MSIRGVGIGRLDVWESVERCCATGKTYDKRTPGFFKVEWCGDDFVGLCSKTYYCFGAIDKYSTIGLSKHQNAINTDAFLDVLARAAVGGFAVSM